MSQRARIRSADLALTNVVAAAALLASVVAPGGWIQASVLALFVLATTGYAVSAALFPPAAIEAGDRYVYTFVFSISAAALTGLLLQVFVRLDREVWITLLVLVVVVASAVAQWRRARLPIQRPRGSMQLPGGPLWALGFLAALATAGVSIWVATSGVHEQQSRQRFASLWALPVDGGIEAGVWNHGGSSAYRLDLSSDGQTLESRRLQLSPGERWRAQFGSAISPQAPSLVLTLYQGTVPYRTVELNDGRR